MTKLTIIVMSLLVSVSMVYPVGPIHNQLFKEYMYHVTARQSLEAQIRYNNIQIHHMLSHRNSGASYLFNVPFWQTVRGHQAATKQLEQELVTLNGIINVYVQELGVNTFENQE